MKKTVLAGLLPTALLALSPLARGETTANPPPTALGEVLITATRSQSAGEAPAGTITVVDQAALDRREARDLADLFVDEPDVVVAWDPRRFGGTQVNIRGMEENRVLMLVDGVRAADYRSPGTTNYDASRRDVPDPEFLKRVEVVRGPGSSLHGSDALGGVVGFLTLDPEDLLQGRALATGGKAAWHSVDRSKRLSAYLAAAGESLQGLLMVSRVEGHEADSQGSVGGQGFTRTEANPQTYDSTNVLAKLGFSPLAGHRVKLTLEARQQDTETNALRMGNRSASSPSSLSRITTNLGDDSTERTRGVVDYDYAPIRASWFDRLAVKAFTQQQKTDNQNLQLRTNTTSSCSASSAGSNNCRVDQRFRFEQNQNGVSLVMEKSRPGEENGAVPGQQLTWGADWLRTRTQEQKDTLWTNLATGVSSNVFLGETFPKSDYPKGHTDQFGLFLQDDLSFLAGRLHLTPGLRYDRYALRPEGDALYRPLSGRSATSQSGSHVSPKLAATLALTPGWQAYAQYAEGFRPPNYEEVNRFFYNNSQFYAVLGNPDLEPETSRGVEAGLRFAGQLNGGEASGQATVFGNRYKDFIDYVQIPASNPAALPGFTTSQYQNLSRVSIRGVELRGQWQARPDLRLTAALAYARGTDDSTGKPLNSIEPRRMTLSALWSPGATWGSEWRLRAASAKDRVDDSQVSGGYFHTPGYAVADLSLWWQINRSSRVNLAANNLFDRRYWLWSDVRRAGVAASDPGLDFYTQPGRNFTLSVKFDI